MPAERPQRVFDQFVDALRRREQWLDLAWLDTKLRYRRTVIGPFWVTISTGVLVLSVGLVYGAIFARPAGIGSAGYMAYFAVGIILWTFISATITEGCVVFVQVSRLIKSLSLPLVLYIYRMLARNFIVFAHNALIIVLLWAVLRWPIGWDILLFVPGLALLVLTLTGIVLTLGILGTRFRDIPPIIGSILQLMFLLTPIIWPASSMKLSGARFILDFNPFYYMIEVVRAPLLGQPVAPLVWLVATVICVLSLAVGIGLYSRLHYRVAYWL